MIPNHLYPILIAFAASIAGCSGADRGVPESQVVVRVNGQAISLQQVQHAIGPNIAELSRDQLKAVAANVLGQLIDEELLVQSAASAALEHEPAIRQALDSQRRQLLSLAYIERLADTAPQRNDENIREFYEQHPALFKQRRIYQIHELFAAIPAERKAPLKAKIAASSEIADVAKWLAAQRLSFRETAVTWPAENVPPELLTPLASMADSEMALLETPKKSEIVLILQLIRATDAGISQAQATAQIEEILANRRRVEVATTEIRRLRENATIEYSPDPERLGSDRREKSVRGVAVQARPQSFKRFDRGFVKSALRLTNE